MPKRLFGLLIACLLLIVPASAGAAPTTVDLRIEGPTSTLYEGPVTTDVRPWQFSSGDTTAYQCDGTSYNAGTGSGSPTPVPTSGAALMAAGLNTTGTWTVFGGGFGAGFSLSTVNGVNVGFDIATNRYMVEYYNNASASTGACAQPIANGDSVLFAYADGSEQLLRLSGPATSGSGQPVTLKVTDAGTGAAIAGATVGGATTNASGEAVVGPLPDGVNAFKASKTGAIRSNTARVCVNTGNTGLCGTPDKTTPKVEIAIKNGKKYRKRGPRSLTGTATDNDGVRSVQLRLSQRVSTRSKRCTYFSASKLKFVKQSRCGVTRAKLFAVQASGGKWSYLLPKAPGRGRYVLDAIVTDNAGNKTIDRTVFKVV